MGRQSELVLPTQIEQLLKWAKLGGRLRKGFGSSEVTEEFGVSRQTAARWLAKLVAQRMLRKEGSTQRARYFVGGAARQGSKDSALVVGFKKSLAGLLEDRVFDEADLRIGLRKRLAAPVWNIAYYAFSEMLNNAIDHSAAKSADIKVSLGDGDFSFEIRDSGYGIFKRIRDSFGFSSEEAAIEHLLKGKQTTAPEAHSGQGIFFTSKIADFFQLSSGRFELTFDNQAHDVRLGARRPLKGTLVRFRVRKQTRRRLDELFRRYANEDFEFDRGEFPVVLLQKTGSMSRSQARRVTMGLDKFARIVFDFRGVSEIGQGFADEVFRVFKLRYPQIVLEPVNMGVAVEFMVRRAIAGADSSSSDRR